jgi:hypothetical protein
MLITLTASLPNVTNTTTMTPRMYLADASPTFVVCGQDQSVIEERFVEIGEVQAVLVEVG